MNRDFKGIRIPKELWLSKDLNIIEKLFYAEIHSLDNSSGCFASNAYFSEFFLISKGRCSQIIKSLESKGYVSIEIQREGKMITKRVVKILNTLFNKLNTPPAKTKYPYLENAQDNNTLYNNTNREDLSLKKELETYIEKWNAVPKIGRAKKPFPKVLKITPHLLSVWKAKRNQFTYKEILIGTRKYKKHIEELKPKNKDDTYFQHRFGMAKFLKQSNGLEEFFNS